MDSGKVGEQSTTRKVCAFCNREFTTPGMTVCPDDGTILVAVKEDKVLGTVLADRYLIESIIGQGGMGIVYRARHKLMDRKVAIKMLHAELVCDLTSVKRFELEAKAASSLNHPHIITLHDYGIAGQQPFLAMEYVDGMPLASLIAALGQIEPKRCVHIFEQVADGLHHAHNHGIVHRDLKPSNIILTEVEEDPDYVKIVDFGLAKLMHWSGKESQHLTKTGEIFGSPIYMSPEQCMGKKLDTRSDIYSMAVAMYEALTGLPPFRGKNTIATAGMHLNEPPIPFSTVRPDLQIPQELERIVFKALAKNPADRFMTMSEMREAMQAAVGDWSGGNDEAMPDRRARQKPASEIRSGSGRHGSITAYPSGVSRSMQLQPDSDTTNNKGVWLATICGAAVLTAGAAFVISTYSTKSASGTIYFYENDALQRGLHVQTDNQLLKLSFGSAADVRLNDENFSANGVKVNLVYKTTDGSNQLVKFAANGAENDVQAADSTVRNFLAQIATGRRGGAAHYVSAGFKDWDVIENKEGYAADLFPISLMSTLSHLSKPSFPQQVRMPDVRRPPSHAIKICAVTGLQAMVLIDSKYVFAKPQGYLAVEMEKNTPEQIGKNKSTWLITRLTKAAQKDWDQY